MRRHNEKRKDNISRIGNHWIVLVVAVILYPIILNWLMYFSWFKTADTLAAQDWLSFWGSYGGGIIGGLGALLSVLLTLRYYRKKDYEQQMLLLNTPLIQKVNRIQDLIENREIIKDENLLNLSINEEVRSSIKKYNELIPHLKGFFAEQAVGTLIGVFQLTNNEGEMFYQHNTLNYFQLSPEIRELSEIIAQLSLYKNCTELLCNDSRLAYIISVEGGGSAGLWPFWWHTQYLHDRDDIKDDLNTLFETVEKLLKYFDIESQKLYKAVFSDPIE